ncbi:MAG: 50S ribosomal protein L15e, partial [Candidatus Aenigmatarchaeota archaeon]
MKNLYKSMKQTRKGKEYKEMLKQRLIEWRKQERFVRVEKPSKPDRARSLGYKAKQGFIIVRARLQRGG